MTGNMKAVILAGGLGTRLQPYTFFIPKPMLPLGNKPLLEHIIEWLKNAGGIDQVVVCVRVPKAESSRRIKLRACVRVAPLRIPMAARS